MKNPSNPKERNLLKGAIRRVFSRSELRKKAISLVSINYHDNNRPRVKKWSKCPHCAEFIPTYLLQVDHIDPIVPVDKALEDLYWDDVINRTWCDLSGLEAICKNCHKKKTQQEQKLRKQFRKKERKIKNE